MCLIIDNNVVGDILSAECPPAFVHIREAIYRGQAVVVYGGKLKAEYIRSNRIVEELMVLDRLGLARQFSDEAVAKETDLVKSLSLCRSDDEHIIALARVSGARLLCSLDHKLHCDFGNKDLICNPRGNVYQDASHKPLIPRHCNTKKIIARHRTRHR